MRAFWDRADKGIVIAFLVLAGVGLVWKHWGAIVEFARYVIEIGPQS